MLVLFVLGLPAARFGAPGVPGETRGNPEEIRVLLNGEAGPGVSRESRESPTGPCAVGLCGRISTSVL